MAAEAIACPSIALAGRYCDTPSAVFMVRCASGVTRIRQRPVGAPSASAGVSKATPSERISCANTSPSWSCATCPMKPARPPSAAMPATVFAAEPPLASIPGAIRSYRPAASPASISRMDPLGMPSRSMKASSAWAITSTRELPMARMSTWGAGTQIS